MNLRSRAKKIMGKCKGWGARDMREDAQEFPREHEAELVWIVKQLEAVALTPKSHARRPGTSSSGDAG